MITEKEFKILLENEKDRQLKIYIEKEYIKQIDHKTSKYQSKHI